MHDGLKRIFEGMETSRALPLGAPISARKQPNNGNEHDCADRNLDPDQFFLLPIRLSFPLIRLPIFWA